MIAKAVDASRAKQAARERIVALLAVPDRVPVLRERPIEEREQAVVEDVEELALRLRTTLVVLLREVLDVVRRKR